MFLHSSGSPYLEIYIAFSHISATLFPLSGLSYDVALGKSGFDLIVQGYGHKLPVLVAKIVEEMQRFASDPAACSADLFQRMKEKSLRNLKNFLFWQPYYHCIVGSLMCLEDPRYSSTEKYTALETATLEDFTRFVSSLLKLLKAQVLVHGNATAAEAAALTQLVCEKLPFKPLPHSLVPQRRVVQLQPGGSYLYRQHAAQNNPNEINSAIENIYMIGLSEGMRGGSGSGVGSVGAEPSAAVLQEAMLELLSHMVSGGEEVSHWVSSCGS